jgi:carbon-monoxide dehydrogenase medium subunit
MLYSEPTSIEAALKLLAEDDGAKCLAGGATLVAMLNAGLLEPTHIVSLRRIAEVQGIAFDAGGRLSIGAMTPHATVERDPRLVGGHFLVREAAGQIAHPAIRAMGTIGGSLAHADPNADYPCALLAAGADVLIAGPGGTRTVPIDEFFVDYLMTVLEPNEIVVSVAIPPSVAGETSCYLKFSRVDGDYATVALGVRVQWSGGLCSGIRIALGACGATPIRVPEAERNLLGTSLSRAALQEAADAYIAQSDPVDDFRGTAEFRRMIIPGLLERAVERARSRSSGDAS